MPVYGLGTYANPSRPLFLTQMEGKTDSSSTTTLTEPNFYLFAGGVAGATTLSGGMQGLYWRPGSAAGTYELGFLRDFGDNPENLDPDLAMWKIAGGLQLQAYRLYDNLASSSTPTISTSAYSFTNLTTTALDLEGWSGGALVHKAREERKLTFILNAAQPWNLWSTVAGGTYATGNPPPIGAKWNQVEDIVNVGPPPVVVGQYLWKTAITNRDVPANLYEAQMVGATIRYDEGWTSVGGAQAMGMFDPATSTWQAVSLWTGIETAAFMDKVSGMDEAQRTAFYEATNIPAFQVGATDLRGSGTDAYLNITSLGILNATFFAPTSGVKPQIWASGGTGGGVNGTYTGAPMGLPGTNFELTGYQPGTLTENGITAHFTVQKWSGTTWGATITNGDAPANSLTGATGFTAGNAITFQGGAAGTFGAGTLTGTAAGIVK